MTTLVGVGLLIAFIVSGTPIGFALGIAGALSLLMIADPVTVAGLMRGVVHHTAANFVLLTIPMFILMSELLSAGGVAQDLMIACDRLMRRVRGGLAVASVLAGAVLAAASGSSTASVATIIRAAYPTMKRLGYDPGFSIATISVAGTLAIMIPPSIALVIYGILTEESIGRLFIAGIAPGILTAFGYVVTIWYCVKRNPSLVPAVADEMAAEEKGVPDLAQKGRVWPVMVLIVLVLGCLYTGVATPTELGALGAAAALVLSLALRRITFQGLVTAVSNSARTTAMIVTIIFGAIIFGYFVTYSQITPAILSWISESGLPPIAVLALIIVFYILLGMVMDQFAIIILTVPITYAVVTGLGFDGIWFGILIVKTAEIGLVTPPVGLNVFIASATSGVPAGVGFRRVVPFVVTELILIVLLVAFPQISLFLPNLMR